MFDFQTVPPRRGSSSFKWDLAASPDVISMSVADADFVLAPFIRSALVECAGRPVFGYTFWPKETCEVTAGWLERRHGWHVPGSAILHCSGVLTGLRATLKALLKPSDAILINTPAYPPFFDLPLANDYRVVESGLISKGGRYTLDFGDLEMRLQMPDSKVMLLCNPHNPVGRVFRREELERIADLALRHNVIIVSDEIHSDIVRSGQKHVPIASLSREVALNTVTIVSPSKTFNVPGLAAAAVVTEIPDLLEKIEHQLKSIGNYHPNPFAIAAYEAAFRAGDDYVNQLNDHLDANVREACAILNAECGPLKACCPEGTYLIWVDCRELGMSDNELMSFFARDAKVGLQSGRLFGVGGAGFMRLNAACPRSVLLSALARIALAITGAQGRSTVARTSTVGGR